VSDRTKLHGVSVSRAVELLDLGQEEYLATYDRQKKLVKELKDNSARSDKLLFVEHEEVYTYGRKSKFIPDGANRIAIERGGEATFHNPGQLVCYPIIRLSEDERDVGRFLRSLEEVLILVLKDFNVTAERRPGATGVWLKDKEKKIASIGIAFSGWVSYHGTALNISNDLAGFNQIHPCGFSSDVMTSMQEQLGSHCPNIPSVKQSYLRHFMDCFHRNLL